MQRANARPEITNAQHRCPYIPSPCEWITAPFLQTLSSPRDLPPSCGFCGKVTAVPVLGIFRGRKEAPGHWDSLGAVGGLEIPCIIPSISTTPLMLDPSVLCAASQDHRESACPFVRYLSDITHSQGVLFCRPNDSRFILQKFLTSHVSVSSDFAGEGGEKRSLGKN